MSIDRPKLRAMLERRINDDRRAAVREAHDAIRRQVDRNTDPNK